MELLMMGKIDISVMPCLLTKRLHSLTNVSQEKEHVSQEALNSH